MQTYLTYYFLSKLIFREDILDITDPFEGAIFAIEPNESSLIKPTMESIKLNA